MAGVRESYLERLFRTAEFSGVEIYEGAAIKGRNPILDFYYAYWCEKCRNGELPARRDIHPEELREYLPYAALFDIYEEAGSTPPFRLTARLIGTHAALGFGEITGRDAAEIPNEATAKRVYYMAALVRAKRRPAMSRVQGYAPGRDHIEAWALYMPLSETGGPVDRIFLAAEGRFGRDAA